MGEIVDLEKYRKKKEAEAKAALEKEALKSILARAEKLKW